MHSLKKRLVSLTTPAKCFMGFRMGWATRKWQGRLAYQIKFAQIQCENLIKAPFLKILFDNCMNTANQRGYIKTILGRRARFDFWIPSFNDQPVKTLRITKGRYKDKPLFRAFTSKALNRLIQGSAADQPKQAMVNAYKAGFDLKLPVR